MHIVNEVFSVNFRSQKMIVVNKLLMECISMKHENIASEQANESE